MTEKHIAIEKLTGAVSLGLLALAINACTPSYEYEAYTTPIGIFYRDNPPSEATRLHEEQHWQDFMDDPLFFFKYSFVKGYACDAEKRANEAGGIYPIDDHPECH